MRATTSPQVRESEDAPLRSFLEVLGSGVWTGQADRVSYRPRWLAPWFTLLRLSGLAVRVRGEELPLEWRVISTSRGARFERRLGRKRQLLAETFRDGGDEEGLVSRRGPFGCLEVRWMESRPEPDTLRLECRRVAWRIGPVALGIPRWAWPEVRQHVWARDDGAIDVAWDVDDSLIGRIFTYEGTLRREASEDQESRPPST